MFDKARELINEAKTIYVVSHTNPDGDAIGSSFAIYFALKNMGKDVNVLMPKYGTRFDFLEYVTLAKKQVEVPEYDLLICTDSSDLDRLNISPEDFYKAKKVIVIDHHVTKPMDADVQVVDTEAPATAEIVYDLLMSQNIAIDKNIAQCIYLGLLTDTGSFNYQRTTGKTMRIAAEMLDKGIDFALICKKMNDTIKESKLQLITLAINNMEKYMDGKIRYTQVEKEDLDRLEVELEDADGVTNYLRMIEGTKVSIYVRGVGNGEYKVSMRSDGYVDISGICIGFGGGGHVRAAGFSINKGDLKKTKEKLLKIVGDVLLK